MTPPSIALIKRPIPAPPRYYDGKGNMASRDGNRNIGQAGDFTSLHGANHGAEACSAGGYEMSSRDLALWCARLLDHAEREAADKEALRKWAEDDF